MKFNELRQSLKLSVDDQVKLLEQMREEKPRYLCSLAWQIFGPPTLLEEAEGDDYAELWNHVVWTEKGREYIGNGEYRYCSIEIDLDHYNEKTGKHIGAAQLAGAITNRPFVKGMADIVLNDDGETSEVMFLMTGRWHHIFYGEFSITVEDIDECVKNHEVIFSSVNKKSPHKPTDMCIDYNHGSRLWDAEGGKAAGWVEQGGVYKKMPHIEAQTPEGGQTRRFSTTTTQFAQPGETPTRSTRRQHMLRDEQVRQILGLAEGETVTDAHREQAAKFLSDNMTSIVALRAPEDNTIVIEGEEETPTDTPETPAAPQPPAALSQTHNTPPTVESLQAELSETRQTLSGVQKQLLENKVDKMLAEARKEGKILPSEVQALRETALGGNGGLGLVVKQLKARKPNLFSTAELGNDTPNNHTASPQSDDARALAAKQDFADNRKAYESMGLTEEDLVASAQYQNYDNV